MTSERYELGYLKTGIEVLPNYLRSEHLFFPLTTPSPIGEPAYRRLTLGGLLLAEARLESRVLPPDIKKTLQSHQLEIEHTRSKKLVVWTQKAEREILSRLRQWKLYLDDLGKDPDHIGYYSSDVSIRVMIELLAADLDHLDEIVTEQIFGLDHRLMAFFEKGAFVWENTLSRGFSPDIYWYLWGKPISFK